MGGPPASSAFNLNHEVYQGRLMPNAEASALATQEAGSAEGNEDEGNQD